MATKKQRARMRQKRIEFDLMVERSRLMREELEAIEKMKKDHLVAYAKEHDIAIDGRMKKAEMLEIIKEKVIE